MNRRTLLIAVGSGSVLAAGCLAGDPETGNTGDEDAPNEQPANRCDADDAYERCGHLIIAYDSFPEPVRCELDAALESGGYTATGRFLLEDAMNVEHAYVRMDDATYEPAIDEAGGKDGERTLTLVEQDRPTRRRVHEMRVENATDERRTIALTVVRESDDEPAVDETLSLEAGEREWVAVSDALGRYECTVSDDRGLEETLESRLGESFQFDELVVGERFTLVESTADIAPCTWEG